VALTKIVGQRVLLTGGRFHGAARIIKVNPKNIKVQMEDTRQIVNCHPMFLSDLAQGAAVPGPREVASSAALPTQWPGALVLVEGMEGVYVVIADKHQHVNVTPLGGDNGRYWRIPRSNLTPIKPTDLLAGGAVKEVVKPVKKDVPWTPRVGDEVVHDGYWCKVETLSTDGKKIGVRYDDVETAVISAKDVTPYTG
jgi:hypothetical protein